MKGFVKTVLKLVFVTIVKWFGFVGTSYLYWRNRRHFRELLSHENTSLCGVYDFRALPYAIGDILTWNMRLCVHALSADRKAVDICVLADPVFPHNIHQNYISIATYQKYLLEMVPLFFFNPMIRNISIYKDPEAMDHYLLLKHLQSQAIFPSVSDYAVDSVRRTTEDYGSYDIINAFFKNRGFVPRFTAPTGIDIWAKNYLSTYPPQSTFVCVHMRQRQRETDTLASGQLVRDAKVDEWLEFFDIIGKRNPEVLFMVIGRPIEWPRELYRRRNVVLIKVMGYGLAEELALVRECDFFMGSNSGPAVMAIFGHKPYVIFQCAENAPTSAKLWGIEVGADRLLFAREGQIIKWGETSVDSITASFEQVYTLVCDAN